ncbi:MAG: hypothetical protein ACO3EI_04640 [Candidatus Limnocylindrus sp.]
MKYESKSEAAHFADYLKGLVVSGRYGRFLPSVRSLAADNGLSVVTVQKAFRLLIEQGLLISSGGTRRPLIVSATKSTVGSNGSLLVVCGAKSNKLPVSVASSLTAIERTLPGLGFSFRRIELRDGGSVSIERLRSEQRAVRPTHILFVHPHPGLMNARLNGRPRVAVLSPVPLLSRKAYRVEVPYLAVPLLTLRKAMEAGHLHISLVDNFLNAKLRKVLLAEADRLGVRLTIVSGGSLGSDNWIHHKTRIREVCSELKACGASCVLFPQWQDFMTATSGFDQAGLEFPERLSVVVAYRNGSSDHYSGHRIAGCDIPDDLAERIVEHWLKGGANDRELFADLVLETWDDGETLRKPVR